MSGCDLYLSAERLAFLVALLEHHATRGNERTREAASDLLASVRHQVQAKRLYREDALRRNREAKARGRERERAFAQGLQGPPRQKAGPYSVRPKQGAA